MWGNGFGRGFGGQGAGSPAFQGTTAREEIAYGFDMNGLQSGIRGVQQGLCDGLYAMNTGMALLVSIMQFALLAIKPLSLLTV